MAESALEALAALPASHATPWQRVIGEVTLRAIDARTVTTLAFAPERAEALGAALALAIPAIGHSSADGHHRRLLALQRDQLWLIEDGDATALAVDGLAWRTDQSDGWVSIAVTGPSCLAVLERLVPLDLPHFSPGQIARTVAEHLAVIVARIDADRFELLSPRSSIHCLAHALETAAAQVAADRALRDPAVLEI